MVSFKLDPYDFKPFHPRNKAIALDGNNTAVRTIPVVGTGVKSAPSKLMAIEMATDGNNILSNRLISSDTKFNFYPRIL